MLRQELGLVSLRPTIAAFGKVDGQLAVGGIPLDGLAERVGSTPFFAYDRALLTARVELLRSDLPTRINLSYAIKANPMPAVVQHLAGLVDSFDVASALEMRTALDTPMPASQGELRRSGQDRGRARAGGRGGRHDRDGVGDGGRQRSCRPATGWVCVHGWRSG